MILTAYILINLAGLWGFITLMFKYIKGSISTFDRNFQCTLLALLYFFLHIPFATGITRELGPTFWIITLILNLMSLLIYLASNKLRERVLAKIYFNEKIGRIENAFLIQRSRTKVLDKPWRLFSDNVKREFIYRLRRKDKTVGLLATLHYILKVNPNALQVNYYDLKPHQWHQLPEPPTQIFCANCFKVTIRPKRYHVCTYCGNKDHLFLGIERLTAAYLPAERAHYTVDRAAGRITLNLAVEAAWAYPHAPLTHVALDLALTDNPDLLLNRVLTHFHVLETHPARIHWQLTGLDALGENTRRLLAERVPGVGVA